MSNSDRFYTLIREFQEKRQNASDVFDREMAELKRYVGSEFYETESKAAADRRDEVVKALQDEYRDKINGVLRSMRETNARREMKPPTTEELNLLQMLRLKNSVSEEELRAAARTLRKNPTALEILGEIGRLHGYSRGYGHYSESRTLGTKSTSDAIAALANGANDFLLHDTRRSARLVQAFRARNYGNHVDDTQLPKRRPIQSKEECFTQLGTMSTDGLEAFFASVDGEEAE